MKLIMKSIKTKENINMKFKNKWENGLKSSKKAIAFSKAVEYMKTEKPKKNHEKTENA